MAQYTGFFGPPPQPIVVNSRVKILDTHARRGEKGTVVEVSENREYTYVNLDSGEQRFGIHMKYLDKINDPAPSPVPARVAPAPGSSWFPPARVGTSFPDSRVTARVGPSFPDSRVATRVAPSFPDSRVAARVAPAPGSSWFPPAPAPGAHFPDPSEWIPPAFIPVASAISGPAYNPPAPPPVPPVPADQQAELQALLDILQVDDVVDGMVSASDFLNDNRADKPFVVVYAQVVSTATVLGHRGENGRTYTSPELVPEYCKITVNGIGTLRTIAPAWRTVGALAPGTKVFRMNPLGRMIHEGEHPHVVHELVPLSVAEVRVLVQGAPAVAPAIPAVPAVAPSALVAPAPSARPGAAAPGSPVGEDADEATLLQILDAYYDGGAEAQILNLVMNQGFTRKNAIRYLLPKGGRTRKRKIRTKRRRKKNKKSRVK